MCFSRSRYLIVRSWLFEMTHLVCSIWCIRISFHDNFFLSFAFDQIFVISFAAITIFNLNYEEWKNDKKNITIGQTIFWFYSMGLRIWNYIRMFNEPHDWCLSGSSRALSHFCSSHAKCRFPVSILQLNIEIKTI